jgi:L-arabinose transport system substrate-binding protein
MKKLLALLLCATLCLGAAAGCASKGNPEGTPSQAPAAQAAKPVIYGIYKAGDQTWFIDEGAAAEAKVKEMGGDFIYVDAKMNPEEYLKAIDNAIANKAAGILTCVPDQTLSQAVVDKLKEAGIPVVAADDALQDSNGAKLAPWVGIDAYVIGQANGEWMAKYATDNGLLDKAETAVLLLTMDTVSSCVPRTEGEYDSFTAAAPSFPKDKIYRADYNGETSKGFDAASAMYTAHPEIKNWLVMTANEEGCVGAVRALEQANLASTSCAIGLGGYLAPDEFEVGSAMKAAAYFSSDAVGGLSAEILMNYVLNSTAMKQETAVPAVIVTPENYKSVMGLPDGGSSANAQAPAEKPLIYGIYKAGDQTWFIDEGAAAEAKVKEMGGDFIYVDAKMNPEEYLKAVDNAIANKAAGILTCIPDQTLSQAVVDKLKDAGIPVVAADDALQDTDGAKLAPWVGIDAYVIGQANGEWMAQYALDNNLAADPETAVLLLTMDTVSSCVPRTEGEYDAFTAAIPSFPTGKIYRADYNGETAKGFDAASAMYTAHPDIKKWLVMTANEEGCVGAVRALEQANLASTSCAIGLGGYLASDEFEAGSAMKAAAYFSSDAVGGLSAEILMNYILSGTSMKQETAVPAVIVTPENYKEIMG